MELYKIIATCANYSGTGNPRTLTDIPENFQGVKIAQNFSFINPIGYTPTYSIETMRVIEGDKIWIDNIGLTYGPNSSVTFAIYKLNSTATAYDLLSAFNVDFKSDTFAKEIDYTEFALKSNSCIDQYNEIKNAPRNFSAVNIATLPTTQKLMNFVSVKKDTGETNEDNTGYLTLTENEDSVFYNGNEDTAITDTATDEGKGRNAYEFKRGSGGTTNIAVRARGSLLVTHTIASPTTLYVKLYKDYANPVVTLASLAVTGGISSTIPIDFLQTKIAGLTFGVNGVLFVGVELADPSSTINDIAGDFSMELFVETELNANVNNRKINYMTAEAILRSIFNNRATVDASLLLTGVTSAKSIIKGNNELSIVPKDFLSDICAAAGLIANFKNDGTVKIDRILTYFNALLDDANAILLTEFKEVSISFDTGLNFSSVVAGMEQKEYETYTYFNNWNKILTFQQIGRSASESLDLSLKRYRVDFSGLLDYIAKYNPVATDTSTDLFFFLPSFGGRTTTEGEIYDPFTPRDMLENWRKFLEFCFYNYSLDTLELVSSSGDDFNLDLYGTFQFDDFVFENDGTRLLPIKIKLKTPLGSTDFTENILKIPNNSYLPESFGEYLYIFVTKSETTDQINEQEITGNLIRFQPT